jgi:hypothetical protein
MAISVKLLRTGTNTTQNTFVVTAATGDSGKLQIQYNDSDIYNNLSGSTSDILSGASNTTITIPLDSNDNIQKGKYYFNFVADVGSSDTHTINFQIDARDPLLTSEVDIYAPSFRVDDNTPYTVNNGTISAASRSLTLQYPAGSLQANISAAASSYKQDLYITTANVWTGSMQTTLAYDVTYTIVATTGYDTFTYQESGIGYDSQEIEPDNALTDLYECIEAQRVKVANAASKKRSNYQELLSEYTYSMSLATQYREAVNVGNTGALNAIIAQIKYNLSCNGASSTASSEASRKVYGLSGAVDTTEVQTIVGAMFEDATNSGVDAVFSSTSGTITLAGRALYLNVYNGTGGAITKGKATTISAYSTAQSLPTINTASTISSARSKAVGLAVADIADAASGQVLLYGDLDGIDTSAFAAGDRLFLSVDGELTATVPPSSGQSQFIGTVLESSAEGRILVSPERAFNFDSIVAGTAAVSALSADVATNSAAIAAITTEFVTVSASAGAGGLNTTPLEIIAPDSASSVIVHSVNSVNLSVTSGTPTGSIALQIFRNTVATYDSNTVTNQTILTASDSAATLVSELIPKQNVTYNVGDGVYLGTSADAAGDGWDNNVGIVVAYTKVSTS